MVAAGLVFAGIGSLLVVMLTVDLLSGGGDSSVGSYLVYICAYGLGLLGLGLGVPLAYLGHTQSDAQVETVLNVLGGNTGPLEKVEHVCLVDGGVVRRETHQLRFYIDGEQTTIGVYRGGVNPILAYVAQVAPHARLVARQS